VSIYIHKKHNVSVLLYHLVCPAKYRRVIFSKEIDQELKQICLEIAKRYEIHFLEIGTDGDHVHFLIQSVPMYQPTKIVRIIKSITAREMFVRRPDVKKQLWGGEFWSDGYFVSTVGKHGNEEVIIKYVKNQGKQRDYVILHKDQLRLDLG
jgi:putative transposase